MAGDWLKFESNTPEKREVLAITLELGFDDPDLTVGKLLRVWRWFDQQTVNGNAISVTPALLDRLIGVTGITQAMANVGWMLINDDGLLLPNFDRHNGKTAKNRALTAKRVANFKGNAVIVSEALPREEKRREEVKAIGDSCESPDSEKLETKKTGYTQAFEKFWDVYGKKGSKFNAFEKWKKLKPSESLQAEFFKAIEAQKKSQKWIDGYAPDCVTWLNGRRWEDEVQGSASGQSQPCEGETRTLASGEVQTYYSAIGWTFTGKKEAA